MVSKRFVAKRLLLLGPVLFGVATVVFAILHLSPGDPALTIAGERASQEFVEEVRSNLGLDDPLWEQYLRFLRETATLEFGQSYQIQRGTPVRSILVNRLPITIELAILGQIAGLLFGLPLGILSAVKQDTLTDHFTRVGALAGISVPIYWSGPLLILLFAQILGVLPTSGRISSSYFVDTTTGLILVDTLIEGNVEAFRSAATHLLMPVVVLGIYSMAFISRMMRSSMLEVIRQDYMRTARAKGQGEKITVLKHGLRNAFIPVITIIGIQFGSLLGGSVLTETVFEINGIGTLLVTAIEQSDYPVVQATVLVFAFMYTLVNLFVDITYSVLDPRIDQ
ncbi:Dipeptide transport system permease protein DppB (TC 3.A.1.5.2) [Halorubrum sp. DM2]|uniref:ABC transporter permease n=1 Tax=unclassified Halorubrum TaxID=2642239 RepID=UPI0003DC5398|nr:MULTISPECIES: ABC transporter permease [unclassified Halorubrum]CDK38828.1 putative signal peptide protein [Halorubrum sp. AJ67]VTT88369.1 Dipeptide transport system permease protein DppB (TC 3.A.1.5.2) [Halorubrum sp. DM2]